MIKILTISLLIIISFLTKETQNEINALDKTENEENLTIASKLYLKKKEIPKSVLLNLVPENRIEFNLFYGTTYPDQKLSETGFFYNTTQQISEQVTSGRNYDFYLPGLQLISFADGEFVEYLKLIIEFDKNKFCKSIRGKEHATHHPIKYYSELYKCK